MRRDEKQRGELVAKLVLTLLWLGFSQATVVLRGGGLASLARVPSNAQPLGVVRVSLAEGDGTIDGHNRKLSGGAVAGIVVGSIFGIASTGSLICCLSRKKSSSSNQEKPGTTSELKTTKSGRWSFFRKSNTPSQGKPVPPPKLGSDKPDPDDNLDTSFVLPELGGPNPHNKFDGMEWIDIKGLSDETLIDISTDLRKYQQRR